MLRIQPLSILLGLALATLCFLTMAPAAPIPAPLRIEFVPHPRDMVKIVEGTPYTVPPERFFVLTALGGSGGGDARFLVNGNIEVEAFNNTHGATVASVPLGLKFPAGSVITVTTPNFSGGRAFGFTTLQ